MPKFNVHMTRMVEEVTTIVLEAANIDEALDKADEIAREDMTLEWEPGDWCESPEAYYAQDEQGDCAYDWNDRSPAELERARR